MSYFIEWSGIWESFDSREEAAKVKAVIENQARLGICRFPRVYVTACSRCGGNCMNCHWADACPQWLDTGRGVALVEVEI